MTRIYHNHIGAVRNGRAPAGMDSAEYRVFELHNDVQENRGSSIQAELAKSILDVYFINHADF